MLKRLRAMRPRSLGCQLTGLGAAAVVTNNSPTSQNVGFRSRLERSRLELQERLAAMQDSQPPKASADWLRALERTAKAIGVPDLTFGRILDELAAAHRERPALIATTGSLSFRDLAATANRYARWALANDVAKGDCVALIMPNCPDYFAIWNGIARVGGVVALINTNLRGQALAHCLDIVRPRHVIVASELIDGYRSAEPLLRAPGKLWAHGRSDEAGKPLRDAIAALDAGPLTAAEQRDVRLSDRALYIYTSGTTGLPKAANVSHRRVLEWSYWFAGLMDTQAGDRVYNCLPMYHSVGGIVAIGSVLVSGGSAVLRDKFSSSQFWDDVAATECTIFQYIGELCRYLMATPPSKNETGHRLRICCGNGLGADVWESFKSRFRIPRILEFYAATEGSFSLYNVEGMPGAIGRLPGFMAHRSPVALVKFDVETQAATRNADGYCVPCADGETGEAIGRLAKRGKDEANRFEGYASDSDESSKIMRNVFAAGDAWFRTGDLMKRDKAGFYYFVDRIGDTYRWKGENVSTLEVATVVAACPGVAQAAVYGVAVPGFDGRAGMAAIVAEDGLDLSVLHEFIATRLPSYARPVFVRIAAALAVTDTFKQKKQQLMQDGFDPARVTDPLFVNDSLHGSYVPLTAEVYARLVKAPD